MMQPPRSTVILQPQPRSGVSWFMPKLCPSSCANVTAAPRGFSEWSYDRKSNIADVRIEYQKFAGRC